MRVLIVSPWYPDYASRYSGVFVKHQVRALQQRGLDVAVEVPQVFPAPTGVVSPTVMDSLRSLASRDLGAAFATIDEATYIPSPVPSGSSHVARAEAYARSISLKREFIPANTDIFHAHLGLPTAWALIELGDRPLVTTEHQSNLGEILSSSAGSNVYESTIRGSSAFICVSPVLKDQLREHYGSWIDSAVRVIPNVVDLSSISYRSQDQYAFRSWIYVGGLAAHKGVELLLESFALFKESVDAEATLTLVGDGNMSNWIRRFARSRGMGASVSLLGPRPHVEVGKLLAAADVMIHLSARETFGVASLEGIGAGLPVISLKNGGSEFAWGDVEEQCGIMLERGADPAMVVESIVELRRDPGRLDSKRGRTMVEERFSMDTVAAQLETVYVECVG